MENFKTKSVGSFVAEDYRTASVFQKYGIDFCCKGGKTIDEVCEAKQISSEELLANIATATQKPDTEQTDFKTWDLDLLADYIQKKHHRYVEETLPALKQYLDKLCKVHGGNHPELFAINEEFSASAVELTMHMQKEEGVLFPFIKQMMASKNNQAEKEDSCFGTVQNPINMMMQEHDVEGERFRKIAELSNNYTPPADACTTYKVAFMLLQEFEEDLHKHIHLENNILFPKSILLEKELAA